MLRKSRGIARVDAVGDQVSLAVGTHDRTGRIDADVGELNLIIAGIRQQPGDQGADLSGAQNEYAMHWKFT